MTAGKLLLINPPLYFSDGEPKSMDSSVPPLGLLSLTGYINAKSDRVRAEVLDMHPMGVNIEELKRRVNKGYLAIGITAMTPQLQGAVECARAVRAACPEVPILLGGPHVSADPGFADRYPDLFDHAFGGEAERNLLQSLHDLIDGRPVPRFQQCTPLENLDEIDFDYGKYVDLSLYNSNLYLTFSRGCPFKCYYCSRPAISKKIRYRSTDRMLAQIRSSYDHCRGIVDFQDDTFTLKKSKVVEFCNRVIESGLKIRWACNARIDLVDEALITLMGKAGCRSLNFGIESGNERVRRQVIHKGTFSNEDIYTTRRWCKKHGIDFICYFMIGHPTETREELEETKNMIRTLGPDMIGLSIPTPFPGSSLWDYAIKAGIIDFDKIGDFAEKRLGEGYAGVYPFYVPEGLTADTLLQELAGINKRFFLSPRLILKRLRKDLTSFRQLRSDVTDFIYLLLRGTTRRKPYIKS